MKRYINHTITLLFICIGIQVYSQSEYVVKKGNPLSEKWRWKHFSELETKGIRHLVETYDNKIWVGYDDGILEYDGYNWHQHGDAEGLHTDKVEKIVATSDGKIYAAASNGIFEYSNGKWEYFFKIPENRNISIFNIEQLKDRSIITSTDWGIIHFLTNGETNFYTSPKLKNSIESFLTDVNWVYLPDEILESDGSFENISDVLEGANNEIWFAISTSEEKGKLLRFKWRDVSNGKIQEFEIFGDNEKLNFGENQKLLLDQDGKLWVINQSNDKGVYIYDNKRWTSIEMNELFGEDELLFDIEQLEDGTIWISSIAKLYSFNNGSWDIYKVPHYPVPTIRIFLHKGVNNRLWLSGYRSKVISIDLSDDHWLSYDDLSFQCKSSPKEKWFLEKNNTVVRQVGNRWYSYGVTDGLMDAPTKIIHTSNDQIWVAGSHNGKAATALWDGASWRMQTHPNLSWGIDYRAVFEAKDGSIWFGAAVDAEATDGFQSGILQLINPLSTTLEWKHHKSAENGLIQFNCYGIGQSPDGNIWIGGSRLVYYNGETWNNLEDERLQQYVNCIYSNDKYLLVGSRYYGLFVYDGKTWKNHSTKNGLLDNTIISINMINDTVIMVSTDKGICKYDGTTWINNIFPEALNMDFEGGSIFNDGSTVWINNVSRTWKRRAYKKSTPKDIDDFFTNRYVANSDPPDSYIDIYQDEVGSEGNHLISWYGKDFYEQDGKSSLSYSYKLNDEPWTNFSKEKQRTFTNLSSGNYTFSVRTRDADFNIDKSPATISFKVKPPIWKQAWFIGLILTFLIIYGFYEYRVHTKNNKLEIVNHSLSLANKELIQKGQQIESQNHEMKMQQSKIIQQSQIVEKQNETLIETNLQINNQKEQLEEMVDQIKVLSKSKMVFFTNISHELRTPLSLILGPINELLGNSNNETRQTRTKLYSTIEKNASRLLVLINQLLEMRSIEEGTLSLNLKNIHIADYLKKVINLFDGIATKRKIDLKFTNNTDNKLSSIDHDKIEKILVNLLSNSFKFTPVGGSIEVTISTVELDKKYPNKKGLPYFKLSVKDNGSGISKEKQDLIFNEYYTTDSNLLSGANTGIGLSYTKSLVNVMEGFIEIDSDKGKGACFSVFFPKMDVVDSANIVTDYAIAKEEANKLILSFEQEEDIKEETKLNRLSILVVEDNPDMEYFLRELFHTKYNVFTAKSGIKGLEMLDKNPIDLVISDIMMDEMDGLTFCETIKTNKKTNHIPVILLTAKTLEDDKILGFEKGADHYVTKPFNPDLLRLHVSNLLKRRDTLRSAFNQEFLLTPKSEELESHDQKLLNILADYMNEYIAEPELNINFLCKKIGISHMHLIRKLKELTGKKPNDLLRAFRMKKAKELLSENKLSVSEVAYKTGFNLPNSFSRTFKKEFGFSPSEYVKKINEESSMNS